MTTFITHVCANANCNNAWVDEDLLRSGAPPRWKLCKQCAGDSFDKQAPNIDKDVSARLKAASRQRYAFAV